MKQIQIDSLESLDGQWDSKDEITRIKSNQRKLENDNSISQFETLNVNQAS